MIISSSAFHDGRIAFFADHKERHFNCFYCLSMETPVQKKRIRTVSDSGQDWKRPNMSTTPGKDIISEDTASQVTSMVMEVRKDSDKTEQPTLSDILNAIKNLEVKMDTQTKVIGEVQFTVEALDERITNIEDSIEHCTEKTSNLAKTCVDMGSDIRLLKDIVIKQQAEINNLKKKQLDLTARSMRCNLLFHNIKEHSDSSTLENCQISLQSSLTSAGIKLIPDIKRIHRLGPYRPGAMIPRPIVAKLPSSQVEQLLLEARKLPKNTGLRISRQLPTEYREQRQKMWKTSEALREADPSCKTRITIEGNLIVNGQLHHEMLQVPKVSDLLSNQSSTTHLPKLFVGETLYEGGSSFTSAVAKATNIQEVRAAYHSYLRGPGKLAMAHNIAVYRLYSPHTARTEEGWVDDGEHGAGKRICEVLHKKNLTNMVVFLTRGTSGNHLGPKRFKLMEAAVESALKNLPSP